MKALPRQSLWTAAALWRQHTLAACCCPLLRCLRTSVSCPVLPASMHRCWSRAVFQRHATFSVFLTLRETSSSRTVADCWLSEEEHGDRGVASEADNRRSDCCLLEQLFPQVERHFLSHLPHLFRGFVVFYRSISPFLFTLHSYASAMA